MQGVGIFMPTPCILGKAEENNRGIVRNKAVSTIDKNRQLG